MLRIEIFNSLLKIQKTLEETQIHKYFERVDTEPLGTEVIAEDYQKISLMFSGLSDLDRQILQQFALHELNSPKLWGRIFSSAITQTKDALFTEFNAVSDGLYYFREYLPVVIRLFRQDSLDSVAIDAALKTSYVQVVDNSILTIVLPEQELVKSRPERLIDALESVNTFYKTITSLNNAHDKDLEVLSLDSGRDKAIDLRGREKTIVAVKGWIMELWDISIFFRERRMTEGIDWVLKTLKVYQQAVHYDEAGRMGPEQAYMVKKSILDASNKFLATGAITPEIEKLPSYDRAKALAFERKLLVKPEENTTTEQYYDAPTKPLEQEPQLAGNYYTDEQVLFNKFAEQELRKSKFKKKMV